MPADGQAGKRTDGRTEGQVDGRTDGLLRLLLLLLLVMVVGGMGGGATNAFWANHCVARPVCPPINIFFESSFSENSQQV